MKGCYFCLIDYFVDYSARSELGHQVFSQRQAYDSLGESKRQSGYYNRKAVSMLLTKPPIPQHIVYNCSKPPADIEELAMIFIPS